LALTVGLRPFAVPRPDAAGSSYVHKGHDTAKSVHKKHTTRRYGIPLLERIAPSGWGYADFHAVVNFHFAELSEVRYPQATSMQHQTTKDIFQKVEK